MSSCYLTLILSVLFLSLSLTSSSPLLTRHSNPVAVCGIGKYDFSTLTAKGDWVGLSDDYTEIYYLNLCSTVKSMFCTLNSNTAKVQVCQVSSGDTSGTYSVMSEDSSATKWSYINGRDGTDGIQFSAQTGEPGGCRSNGASIGKIICGNTTGIISEIVENPQCTYTLTIPTPMVCSGTETPDQIATVDPAVLERIAEIQRQQGKQPTRLI